MKSRVSTFSLLLILGSLSAVSPFAIDLYLAAFPEMATGLGTTVAKVSLSLSSYFVGLASGQLIYGPCLDRFGRKPPLYFGLTLFILASLACLQSKSVEALIAWRLLQGLGGCVASVASMAMVRDFFTVAESARVFSILVLILGASPLLAPSFGSYVSTTWGWPSVFWVLSAMAATLLGVVRFILPEGHKPDPTVSLRPSAIFRSFREILSIPQFSVYVLAGAFAFGGLFAYVAGSPILFLNYFKVTPQAYGLIFAGLSIGFIGSSQLNIALTRRYSSEQIFRLAMFGQVAAGTLLFIGTISGWFGFGATTCGLFLFLSSVGLIFPNASAIALAPFSHNAGAASALMGFIQMGIGAVISTSIGALDAQTPRPIVTVLFATAWVGFMIYILGGKRIGKRAEMDSSLLAVNLH